jgi:hypothetical protein
MKFSEKMLKFIKHGKKNKMNDIMGNQLYIIIKTVKLFGITTYRHRYTNVYDFTLAQSAVVYFSARDINNWFTKTTYEIKEI